MSDDLQPEHHCHALLCRRYCPPEYLMCGAHWAKVPRDIQRAVYRHYRVGQCDDKKFTKEWSDAADAAIMSVGLHEHMQLSLSQLECLKPYVKSSSLPTDVMMAIGAIVKADADAKLTSRRTAREAESTSRTSGKRPRRTSSKPSTR